MIPYTDDMPEVATYWPPAGSDGFGNATFGAPVPLPCRWQNMAQLFRDNQGREVMSRAVVYIGGPVETLGALLRGESADATPPAGALQIRQTMDSPGLDGDDVLHKVVL